VAGEPETWTTPLSCRRTCVRTPRVPHHRGARFRPSRERGRDHGAEAGLRGGGGKVRTSRGERVMD
jgi:hypothetical protein